MASFLQASQPKFRLTFTSPQVRVTCPSHDILPHYISLIIFNEREKLRSYLLCCFYRRTLSFFTVDLSIFPLILFSTFLRYSCVPSWRTVSHTSWYIDVNRIAQGTGDAKQIDTLNNFNPSDLCRLRPYFLFIITVETLRPSYERKRTVTNIKRIALQEYCFLNMQGAFFRNHTIFRSLNIRLLLQTRRRHEPQEWWFQQSALLILFEA